MTKIHTAVAAALLLSTTACATVYENAAENVGSATIYNNASVAVGTATLYSLAGEVTLSASFDGLSEGTHAVHLHTKGDCGASDFTSAGGHLNPGGNQHGTENPRGAHLGDLPNVQIGSDGVGTMSAILRGTSATVLPQIFDADGAAIVVHAGADDYRSDPAGDAGSRVACGVLAAG